MAGSLEFPENFLFGTATSSHQIEGGNVYNDWYYWELKNKLPKAGMACNSWRLYGKDIGLMAKLGYNAYRFSVEWSRIQPEIGEWRSEAVKTYVDMLKKLHEHSIEPLVTLHHFTNPIWFIKRGGWEREENIDYFAQFVEKIVEELKEYVRIWITVNEPAVLAYMGWGSGEYPPFKRDAFLYFKVLKHLLMAHAEAYKIIKNADKKFQVGLAKHFTIFQPAKNYFLDKLAADTANGSFNLTVVEALEKGVLPGVFIKKKYKEIRGAYDFWGVNYYTRHIIRFNPLKIMSLFAESLDGRGDEVTDMGWDIYPQGLYEVLIFLKKYKKPIIITENGIATRDDDQRICFIVRHLYEVWRALKENVDVRGYMYWSFIDNYEWTSGFKPRFGLVEVDYVSFERKPRKSAFFYGKIAMNKQIEEDYLRRCLKINQK